MDEELQKRNTDCVYFLASPLTCKKGIDCEYRHCEIARLNPRDCWYWLSGSCFNPTCAFRHPPLDVHTGAASESVPSSVPVNKTNVPCYFYFNGFCNKGDRCCFLHDINADAAPGEKLVKTALANSEVPNLEKDTLAVRETGSAPSNKPSIQQQTNKPFKPPATIKAEADTTVQHKEDFQPSEPEDVSEQSGSSPISVSVCEETATIRSDSFAAGELVRSISYACEELSSEEQVDERIVPEERWESSPGFDVLVDDDSENLDSEDDPENILTLERGRRDLNSHLFGYDFENQVEYDSRYPGMEIQYESEAYRSYNRPVSEDIFGDVRRNIAGRGEVRMFDSILSCKRKLIPMELALDNHHRDVDLRDRLKRRQFVDGDPLTGLSRIRESNQLIGRSLKRPWQHGMARPRERSASDIGRSASDNGTFSKGRGQHGFPRHLQKYQPRRHYKEKRPPRRHFLSSEVSSKRLPKVPRERSTRGSSSFSGPKTLTQIKEEKRRPEKDGVSTRKKGSYSRKSSVDFQGPKPLSEILKNKGKLTHESEGNT